MMQMSFKHEMLQFSQVVDTSVKWVLCCLSEASPEAKRTQAVASASEIRSDGCQTNKLASLEATLVRNYDRLTDGGKV